MGCALAVFVHAVEAGVWGNGEAVSHPEAHEAGPAPVRWNGGGGARRVLGAGAVEEGELCVVEAGAGGGEKEGDGREWTVQAVPALHEEPRSRTDDVRGLRSVVDGDWILLLL